MIESLNETEAFHELCQLVGQPLGWKTANLVEIAIRKLIRSGFTRTVEVTDCRVVEDEAVEFTVRILMPTQRQVPNE